MQKNKKRKLRKNFLPKITCFIFLLSGFCYLGSSIFVRSYNNCLSTSLQTIQHKISTTSKENDEVLNEVNQLSSSLRVQSMTNQEISFKAQNIVSVD